MHNCLICFLIISTFAFVQLSANKNALKTNDNRRPIYVVASMVNTIKELDHYVNEGANAIEADVYFEESGDAKNMFENWPCACNRKCGLKTPIDKYLKYVNDVTKPGREEFKEKLILLVLDLRTRNIKTSKYKAGIKFAQQVIQYLFDDGRTTSRIYLQLSLNSAKDADFVIGFEDELAKSEKVEEIKHKIGWDVGLNDKLEDIDEMWTKIKSVKKIWIGDGTINCLSSMYKYTRLNKVLNRRKTCRDVMNEYCPKKVFIWMIDSKNIMFDALK
ncbi:hypothetical protein B4U80_00670 [Leptotrombidium deliense]|uniref:Sphingomyelinase D-like protein n=1 Tax=Leptotrombidium deliense TaxID=299467 RepID=A0A443S180_9ACAR|nr:hypothetical protein B4U80_00670 [Leptotrombidium deliense]